MNLYLISQTENQCYDTYDSAVVAAPTEDDARLWIPGEGKSTPDSRNWKHGWNDWCKSPDAVKVELIGISNQNEEGIILASFNAG
jgi:hypothetical protein